MDRAAVFLIMLAGCGRLGFDAIERGGVDAPEDSSVTIADSPTVLGTFGDWGMPVRQTMLNTNSQEFGSALSRDGLEIVFGTRFTGDSDLYLARRADRASQFGAKMQLTNLNTPDEDGEPSLSRDGLTLLFQRNAAPITIFEASRASPAALSFSAATPIQPQAAFANFGGPDFGPDDLTLVTNKDGTLYESTRATVHDPWSAPVSLGITGGVFDGFPTMRSDGLELLWESSANPPTSIFRATRASRQDAFGAPLRVVLPPPFDVAGCGDPDLSEDGTVMAFVSDEPGGAGLYDVYITTRVQR